MINTKFTSIGHYGSGDHPSISEHKHNGYTHLFTGPMFSGKTSLLMKMIRTHKIADDNVLLIKSKTDSRSPESKVKTHYGETYAAITTKNLMDIDSKMFDSIDVIAVDEGQFFTDLVDFCEFHSNRGRKVYVAALNSTFERKVRQKRSVLRRYFVNISRLKSSVN